MTKNILKRVYKQNIINEDLHKMLLKAINQSDFETIYEKTFEDDGNVKELRQFRLRDDETLKGFMLNSFDITGISSEDEAIEVKKDVFIMENGVILVFHRITNCFKDSNTQTWITVSERLLSTDRTLTKKEQLYVEKEIAEKLKDQM